MIMSTNDFIPQSDQLFLVWIKTLLECLQTKISPWGVPQAAVTELSNLITLFDNALALAENPATCTKVQMPKTVPEAEVKLTSPDVVEIHFRDAESDRRAKPEGIHGADL
jgi:hypothetical protein